MSMLDKLKFWKKDDNAFAELDKQLGTIPQTSAENPQETALPGHSNYDTSFGNPSHDDLMRSSESGLDFGKQADTGFQGFGMEHPSEKQTPAYEQSRQMYEVAPQQPQAQNVQQQLELVAAKLDTIRVSLESINHRLVAVERALHVQDYQEVPPKRRRGVW